MTLFIIGDHNTLGLDHLILEFFISFNLIVPASIVENVEYKIKLNLLNFSHLKDVIAVSIVQHHSCKLTILLSLSLFNSVFFLFFILPAIKRICTFACSCIYNVCSCFVLQLLSLDFHLKSIHQCVRATLWVSTPCATIRKSQTPPHTINHICNAISNTVCTAHYLQFPPILGAAILRDVNVRWQTNGRFAKLVNLLCGRGSSRRIYRSIQVCERALLLLTVG